MIVLKPTPIMLFDLLHLHTIEFHLNWRVVVYQWQSGVHSFSGISEHVGWCLASFDSDINVKLLNFRTFVSLERLVHYLILRVGDDPGLGGYSASLNCRKSLALAKG
jgi:hypothetical protein